jgi:site-specific recombinase XerC
MLLDSEFANGASCGGEFADLKAIVRLRKACAEELLRRTGGNLRAVQAHLRHADIQTTTPTRDSPRTSCKRS